MHLAEYHIGHGSHGFGCIGSCHANIILREALHQAFVTDVFPKHPPTKTLLRTIELSQTPVGQVQQSATAALLLARVYYIWYLQRLSTGAFGVCEYVQSAEGNGVLQKIEAVLEKFGTLPSCAHDDVDADKSMGQ